MRVFFALPIPETTILEIAAWRDKMLLPQTNWIPLANFHITLAFLGQVSPTDLERLCANCSELVARRIFKAGELTINQTGYWSKPGILWLGPSEWPDTLSALNIALSQLGRQFRCRTDKKLYQPHITLARQALAPAKPLVEPNISLHFDSFSLYESRNGASGVHYHLLDEWPLSEN